ncbi:MAG TPA: hypothetical protein VI732_00605 [Alphaproteobacteria bacterium]|nr:hypothetical protein [Alphaproteobacteria bacterium]
MKHAFAVRAVSVAALCSAILACTLPSPARAQSCPGNLDGQTMNISGRVIGIVEDMAVFMTILDDDTGCRVSVAIQDTAEPCPYGGRASVSVHLSKVSAPDFDYLDSPEGPGGTFSCQ